jgi:NAD(P)-dependent dehydrogenase (short-subunit alcohol dehydrogenase family)
MGQLQDKVCIVTGGAGSIGLAGARRFVAEGAKVMLVDLQEQQLRSAAAELPASQVAFKVGDVGRATDVRAYVDATIERWDTIDVLFSNAGVIAPLAEYPEEVFDDVWRVHVKGALRRNGGRRAYRASAADQAVWNQAQRPKRCKLATNPALARVVADKLQLEWSPHQVAGWLKRTYPQDETRQVSHETIYRTLFIQARGALKKELLQHLRRTRGMRRSRHHTQKTPDHGRITETVSIRERPAEAEDRAVPGHWEAIYSLAVTIARSRPSWNARHATSCSRECQARTPKRS